MASDSQTAFEKWRTDVQFISTAILAARPSIGDERVENAYSAFQRLSKKSQPAKMIWGGFLFFAIGYAIEYAMENFSRGTRACSKLRIDKS